MINNLNIELNRELVSIICTVKNGEQTLEQTIISVLKQTHNNWEFIIVDDGSNDETKNILNAFSVKDDRIKPIFTPGIGRAKALNLAIKHSQGNFVANIDADDLMHPKRIDIQLTYLIKYQEALLICANAITFIENNFNGWFPIKDINITNVGHNMLIKNRINHSAVMFNKEVLQDIGGYNELLTSQIDYDLWLRGLLHNKPMFKCSSDLVGKRVHKNQSFENKNRLKYLINSQKIQIKYAFKMKKYRVIIIFITPIRIFLGILPFTLRKRINKLVKKLGNV